MSDDVAATHDLFTFLNILLHTAFDEELITIVVKGQPSLSI